jgi:Xaa-Pro aminopeptidase
LFVRQQSVSFDLAEAINEKKVQMNIPLPDIQAALAEENLDGWLLYDFHGSNPIARELAVIEGFVSRRWFCWLPREGQLTVIHHTMEREPFDHLAGHHRHFLGWPQLDEILRETLGGAQRIAMEYSPDNAIPYVARVDAGTIDKLRGWGFDVVSSADLVGQFLARCTQNQVAGHRRAAAALIQIKNQAFDLIASAVRDERLLTEHDVVEFIRSQFEARGMTTDDGPICAVDAHAGSPHYVPHETGSAAIEENQLILIDLWAKEQQSDAVYGDISWTAYTGSDVPAKMAEVFQIVCTARDRAVSFLSEQFASGIRPRGCDVDDAVRAVITDAGYGEYFIHRTGHSIGTDVHGVGTCIDNLETNDQRRLLDGMLFSIEPGIYLPEFGIRSEIDVLIENSHAVVTTLPLQTEITPLLT